MVDISIDKRERERKGKLRGTYEKCNLGNMDSAVMMHLDRYIGEALGDAGVEAERTESWWC